MRTLSVTIALSLACSLQNDAASGTGQGTSGGGGAIPETQTWAQPDVQWPTPPQPRLGALPPVQIDESCLFTAERERRMHAPPPPPAPMPAPMPMGAAPRAESGAAKASAGDYSAPTAGMGASLDAASAQGASVATAPAEPAARPAPKADAPAKRAASADEDDRELAKEESIARPWPESKPQPPRGPTMDWGGVVHLSNDDAMSLASAQRLLYALDRGVGFTTAQIRPHELLNYFSFDTAPAVRSTFSVAASAERVDHDTLALALAVKGASPPRAALDLTLLIDRSGSMSAEGRMAYTQRALQQLSGQLHHGDRVDLVLFDHAVCTPIKDFVVGRDDPALLRRMIDGMAPRGSTDLNLGLREAYQVATSHVGQDTRAGRVMVFTDAILNTGDVNPETVSEVGRHLDQHGIRLTGVGVGSDFRDDVLNKLTEKGKGAYVFLGSERVVDRLFGQGFDSLVHTIAEDVRFALDLPDSLGMEKFFGEESSRDPEAVQPVSYQAGATQVFFQDLAIRDGYLQPGAPIDLNMEWTDPASGQRRSQLFRTTVGEAMAADPHNVRKARALMTWSDTLMAHSMGVDTCGSTFGAFKAAASAVSGDAEIAYIDGLIGRWCTGWTPPAPPPPPIASATKVRVDADQPVSSVELSCGGRANSYSLTGSDTIATFRAPAGACNLTLWGAVPMTQVVTVPPTGADLRCVVRAGRMSCG
jgi:Ca-activated chloride channel family protein